MRIPFLRALLAALVILVIPAPSFAGVFIGISIGTPPPPLPFYAQPLALVPNDIWIPGYWAWGPGGYFWVPGTWVMAPRPGLLWTPGYWGWDDDAYMWHPGYWGRRVGFYGDIDYGYGYFGRGYVGGAWFGNVFRYNTAVTNVNRTFIRNVYVDRTVVVNKYVSDNRVSYTGGAGGIRANPTAAELRAERERHFGPTPQQRAHIRFAARDRNLLASVNHGRPALTAVARPFTRMRRPENFAPITRADRRAARAQVVRPSTRVRHPAGSRKFAARRAIPRSTPHPRRR